MNEVSCIRETGDHQPFRRLSSSEEPTLFKLGIPGATFYRCYDWCLAGDPETLEDHRPRPSRGWNRILEPVREKIKNLATQECILSPCELAVVFSDTEKLCVSEASVYRFN